MRPLALCAAAAAAALLLALGAAVPARAQSDLASAVNPLIGTATNELKDNGNTVPGATMPFGMLAWSPDPAQPAPDSGGMYRYENPSTRGFSLLHLSGPGCGAFGDIPIFPMLGTPATSPSLLPLSYGATFRHADEVAQPGFYSVKLSSGIAVQLAASVRSGIAEFTFPTGGDPHTLLLDLSRNLNHTDDTRISIEGSHISGSVSGSAFCGLANRYTVFFSLHAEQAPQGFGTFTEFGLHPNDHEASGPRAGGYLQFAPGTTTVRIKVGLSFVSAQNAEANLAEEIPGWNFDEVRSAARAAWNQALGHAVVTGGTADQRTVFYTALYHVLLEPNIFSDRNGDYMGFDGTVHHVDQGRVQYANFSGWDIYRSQVQLITMLFPKVGSDLAASLVADAQQGGGLPIWPLANDESSCMVGDPSDLILASIYAFGGRDFDTAAALRAMLRGADDPSAHVRLYPERPGLAGFLKLGYVPEEPGAVERTASVTLEDESADFAIARFAQALGDTASARRLDARAAGWRKLFDPSTRYIRARDTAGNFLPNFTPGSYDGFVEGNSAQYTWMVPYDLSALIQAIGGNAAANARLDSYFSQYGSYALNRGPFFYIANEPSFGNPWIYNWSGASWRTDEVVHKTLADLFRNTPDGLPGNDDLGATSSWIVFAQLGLYPEIPAVAGLTTNSPTFQTAVLTLGNGNQLTVEAEGAGTRHYTQALFVDGKRIEDHWLPWSLFEHAHQIRFELSAEPQRSVHAPAPPPVLESAGALQP